jgi:hypothetical protein
VYAKFACDDGIASDVGAIERESLRSLGFRALHLWTGPLEKLARRGELNSLY